MLQALQMALLLWSPPMPHMVSFEPLSRKQDDSKWHHVRMIVDPVPHDASFQLFWIKLVDDPKYMPRRLSYELFSRKPDDPFTRKL
jgi:hypothetical protein